MKGQNSLCHSFTYNLKSHVTVVSQYALSVLNKLIDWNKLTFYVRVYSGGRWGSHGFYQLNLNLTVHHF